jgi:hypothetical protein
MSENFDSSKLKFRQVGPDNVAVQYGNVSVGTVKDTFDYYEVRTDGSLFMLDPATGDSWRGQLFVKPEWHQGPGTLITSSLVEIDGIGNPFSGGAVKVRSTTIIQPTIALGEPVWEEYDPEDEDDDDGDDDEGVGMVDEGTVTLELISMPSPSLLIQGHPLGAVIDQPLDGFVIHRVGRDADGEIYVTLHDAASGEDITLSARDAGAGERLQAGEAMRVELCRVIESFEQKVADATRCIQDQATEISDLKAQLAALTTAQTAGQADADWVQSAPVGAMGQSRVRPGYQW